MDEKDQKMKPDLLTIAEGEDEGEEEKEEECNIENKEKGEENENTQAEINIHDEEAITVDKSSYSMSYCRTSIKTTTFDYLWEINHFSNFCKSKRALYSVRFPTSGNYQIMIKFNADEKIEFHLITKTPSMGKLDMFKVYSIAEDRILFESHVGHLKTKKLYEIPQVYLYGLDSDTLTLCFEFTLYDGIVNEFNYIEAPKQNHVTKRDDIINVCHEICNTDRITLVIKGKHYDLPTKLLCSYEYFRNKYKLGMKEIEINIEISIFEEILNYIITGRLSLLISLDTLKTLMRVACDYTIKDMLLECEERLMQNVTIPTVIELFFFASSLNAENLKAYTTHVLKFYLKEVVSTPAFKMLSTDNLENIFASIVNINMHTKYIKF